MMVVDRLGPSDCAAVDAIARRCGIALELERELGRPFSRSWVARARRGSPPIAFLVARWLGSEAEVLDLVTDPAHRRRGAARALMHRALAEARLEGLELVCLEVRESNEPARHLYGKLGFTLARVRRGYYSDTCEDALELRLELGTRPRTEGLSR